MAIKLEKMSSLTDKDLSTLVKAFKNKQSGRYGLAKGDVKLCRALLNTNAWKGFKREGRSIQFFDAAGRRIFFINERRPEGIYRDSWPEYLGTYRCLGFGKGSMAAQINKTKRVSDFLGYIIPFSNYYGI